MNCNLAIGFVQFVYAVGYLRVTSDMYQGGGEGRGVVYDNVFVLILVAEVPETVDIDFQSFSYLVILVQTLFQKNWETSHDLICFPGSQDFQLITKYFSYKVTGGWDGRVKRLSTKCLKGEGLIPGSKGGGVGINI